MLHHSTLLSSFYPIFHHVFGFQAASEFDLAGIFYYVLTLVCVFVWPYFFCYFASFVIDRMANIQHTVYNLNWLDFPIEQRKYFIVIMAQSQRNVRFHGLKLVSCSLPIFVKVK